MIYVPKFLRETLKTYDNMKRNLSKEREKSFDQQLNLRKSLVENHHIDKSRKFAQTPSLTSHAAHLDAFDPNMICTDGEESEFEEFERWKKRELERFKRQKEISNVIDGPYSMTRPVDKHDLSLSTTIPIKLRSKMKFLQKYYHKGSFFQTNPDDKFGTATTDSIYSRDFWSSTPADNFDKTLLPAVMQVKNFGRRGRTKWTHLVAEDTSSKSPTFFHDTLTKKEKQKKIHF